MRRFLKKTIILCLLGLLLSLTVLPCFAEETNPNTTPFSVKVYSDTNGVPTGEANAVLQTRDGYVWIGGYGGLQRYDGVTHEPFSGTRALTSYSIRSLWQSADGTLWVGSNDQGAFRYDGTVFCQPKRDGSGKFLSVRCFAEDSKGRVWIGTSDGLCFVENDEIKPYSAISSTVYTLSADSDGVLWGVDYSGALFAIDSRSDSLAFYFSPGDLWAHDLYAYSALVASDGTIYVGTSGSAIITINRIAGKFLIGIVETGGLSSINSICETADGNLWFCGDHGIGYLKDGTFTDCSYLAPDSFLVCVTEDYEHNIWAASLKYGVLHIREGRVSHLSNAPELSRKEVYTVCKYGGLFYVGSENGMLVFDDRWARFNSELAETFQGVNVHHMIAGSDEKLYIGTYYQGLYVYDGTTNQLEHLEIDGLRCRCLLELSDGAIAVGTDKGLDVFRGEHYEGKEFTPMAQVLCLLEDGDGSVLCGTDGNGIIRVGGGDASPYANSTRASGLSGGVILRMEKDSKEPGKLWVSCGTDVFFGNAEGFRPVHPLRFGSGSILDIFALDDEIWLFRSSGILHCKRSELLDTESDMTSLQFYAGSDGIPGPIVSNSWSMFDGRRFYVCTIDGIGFLDTKAVFSNVAAPKSRVTGIEFGNDDRWDGSDHVVIGNTSSELSIHFSALTYAGENIQVSFWLEGLEKKPTVRYIQDQHGVTYTNLAAGTYVFHLNAINSDGVIGPECLITFVKNPRFIETRWFPIAIFGGTTLLIALIAFLRVRAASKKIHEYRRLTNQTIMTIANVIDAKDPYTMGHSGRVSDFSVEIARRIGMKEKEIERLRQIAFLHDIGKISVPDSILHKPGKLTDEEYEVIKRHTVTGGEMLRDFSVLPGAAEGARFHHERFDGKGYCAGIAGEDIPLFARIIAVADSFDAMNSSRCYRDSLTMQAIVSEIKKGKGTQFDPKLADVALEIIAEKYHVD